MLKIMDHIAGGKMGMETAKWKHSILPVHLFHIPLLFAVYFECIYLLLYFLNILQAAEII